MSGTPTDWVSGERVFAPPTGTVDPDWLVPALLERHPEASPEEARRALVRAWDRHRAGSPGSPDGVDAAGSHGGAPEEEASSSLRAAAEAVVLEAARTFRA